LGKGYIKLQLQTLFCIVSTPLFIVSRVFLHSGYVVTHPLTISVLTDIRSLLYLP